jgi:serine/threonine-protein kinase/endoribonuclease IRE1
MRPSIGAVAGHPCWWPPRQKLQFLIDTSDAFELCDRSSDSTTLKQLEATAPSVFPPGDNWAASLEQLLISNLHMYRSYKYSSVRDLLRVIRNKYNHFREMPPELQAILGQPPDDYYGYFAERFPRLLLTMFFFVLCTGSHTEALFQKYDVVGLNFGSCAAAFKEMGPSPPPAGRAAMRAPADKLLKVAGVHPPPHGTGGITSRLPTTLPGAGRAPSTPVSCPGSDPPPSSCQQSTSGGSSTTTSDIFTLNHGRAPSQPPPPDCAGPTRTPMSTPHSSVPAVVSTVASSDASGHGSSDSGNRPHAQPRNSESTLTTVALSAYETRSSYTCGSGDQPGLAAPPSQAMAIAPYNGAVFYPPSSTMLLVRSPPMPMPALVHPRPLPLATTNAVPARTQVGWRDSGSQEYTVESFPQNPGSDVCAFFVQTGFCRFGASCFKHHPDKYRVRWNVKGYPMRPGEPECSFYMQTSVCKYGAACKFHHPNLEALFAGSDLPHASHPTTSSPPTESLGC